MLASEDPGVQNAVARAVGAVIEVRRRLGITGSRLSQENAEDALRVAAVAEPPVTPATWEVELVVEFRAGAALGAVDDGRMVATADYQVRRIEVCRSVFDNGSWDWVPRLVYSVPR